MVQAPLQQSPFNTQPPPEGTHVAVGVVAGLGLGGSIPPTTRSLPPQPTAPSKSAKVTNAMANLARMAFRLTCFPGERKRVYDRGCACRVNLPPPLRSLGDAFLYA